MDIKEGNKLLRYIEISKRLKKEVEKQTCDNCGQLLRFVSAEFDEHFIGVAGETSKVDTICLTCKARTVVCIEYYTDKE